MSVEELKQMIEYDARVLEEIALIFTENNIEDLSDICSLKKNKGDR